MNVFIFQVILFMIMDFIAASQDLRDSKPGDQKRPNPLHCYLFIYLP